MKKTGFQPGFPGRFVRTQFSERAPDGSPRTVSGDAFVPTPLPPEVDRVTFIGGLYDVLDRARTSLLRLEARVDSLPSRTVLLAAMRTREAQASSRIENTIASLRDIALASIDPNRVTHDAVEVTRNRDAIVAGLESELPVCGRLLREMHKVLVIDPSERPGEFRDLQVCIGDENRAFDEARFVPPPPAEIPECMKQWELFVNLGRAGPARAVRMPYLIELAWAHYQFETIHPFSDGNGRLGRALVNVAPVKDGFLKHPVCNLSEWVHEHRRQYYDGLLRVSTHGDWPGWTRFFCTALAEQAELDLQRADRVAKLYDKYHALITKRQKSIMLTRLVDHLFEVQATTVATAAEAMGVSYTAAQRHVEFLVKNDVLKQVSEGNYGKVYLALGIVRAIRGQGEE